MFRNNINPFIIIKDKLLFLENVYSIWIDRPCLPWRDKTNNLFYNKSLNNLLCCVGVYADQAILQ